MNSDILHKSKVYERKKTLKSETDIRRGKRRRVDNRRYDGFVKGDKPDRTCTAGHAPLQLNKQTLLNIFNTNRKFNHPRKAGCVSIRSIVDPDANIISPFNLLSEQIQEYELKSEFKDRHGGYRRLRSTRSKIYTNNPTAENTGLVPDVDIISPFNLLSDQIQENELKSEFIETRGGCRRLRRARNKTDTNNPPSENTGLVPDVDIISPFNLLSDQIQENELKSEFKETRGGCRRLRRTRNKTDTNNPPGENTGLVPDVDVISPFNLLSNQIQENKVKPEFKEERGVCRRLRSTRNKTDINIPPGKNTALVPNLDNVDIISPFNLLSNQIRDNEVTPECKETRRVCRTSRSTCKPDTNNLPGECKNVQQPENPMFSKTFADYSAFNKTVKCSRNSVCSMPSGGVEIKITSDINIKSEHTLPDFGYKTQLKCCLNSTPSCSTAFGDKSDLKTTPKVGLLNGFTPKSAPSKILSYFDDIWTLMNHDSKKVNITESDISPRKITNSDSSLKLQTTKKFDFKRITFPNFFKISGNACPKSRKSYVPKYVKLVIPKTPIPDREPGNFENSRTIQNLCHHRSKTRTLLLTIVKSKLSSDTEYLDPSNYVNIRSRHNYKKRHWKWSRRRRRKSTNHMADADDELSDDECVPRKRAAPRLGPINIKPQDLWVHKSYHLRHLCNSYGLASDGPDSLLIARLHQYILQSTENTSDLSKPVFLKYKPRLRRSDKKISWVRLLVSKKIDNPIV